MRMSVITSAPRAVPKEGLGLLAMGLVAAGGAAVWLARRARAPHERRTRAARLVEGAASTLALAVLADSSLEHYTGGFYNPVMFVAPTMAAATLAAAADGVRAPAAASRGKLAVFVGAAISGIVGLGFHVYDIARRTGGFSWGNLFYAAPVGAPAALNLAGLLGLAGSRIARDAARSPKLLGLPAGPALGVATAAALAGTSAEAALLHFRGAYHDPFMYLPITVPPATGVALAVASITGRGTALARLMLRFTAFLGVAGVGFHAYGIARNMGGWKNWTQNLQAGPPLPAPPAFAGLALAGLAALELQRERER